MDLFGRLGAAAARRFGPARRASAAGFRAPGEPQSPHDRGAKTQEPDQDVVIEIKEASAPGAPPPPWLAKTVAVRPMLCHERGVPNNQSPWNAILSL